MSAEGSPPKRKKPASGETSGSGKASKSAITRESTFANVLDRAFDRLSVVEEKLWKQITGGCDDISSIQAWLNVAYELRPVSGHRAKSKGAK
jgi:hypothetical protein